MKINFNQEITREDGSSIVNEKKKWKVVKNEAGEFVPEPSVEHKEITTLGDVCRGALTTDLVKISVTEKMNRYRLYQKIKEDAEVELLDEELSTLKELISEKYDLLMTGKVLLLLGEKL